VSDLASDLCIVWTDSAWAMNTFATLLLITHNIFIRILLEKQKTN
jgi:hypothetical protein